MSISVQNVTQVNDMLFRNAPGFLTRQILRFIGSNDNKLRTSLETIILHSLQELIRTHQDGAQPSLDQAEPGTPLSEHSASSFRMMDDRNGSDLPETANILPVECGFSSSRLQQSSNNYSSGQAGTVTASNDDTTPFRQPCVDPSDLYDPGNSQPHRLEHQQNQLQSGHHQQDHNQQRRCQQAHLHPQSQLANQQPRFPLQGEHQDLEELTTFSPTGFSPFTQDPDEPVQLDYNALNYPSPSNLMTDTSTATGQPEIAGLDVRAATSMESNNSGAYDSLSGLNTQGFGTNQNDGWDEEGYVYLPGSGLA
jgi:hypothetical protein